VTSKADSKQKQSGETSSWMATLLHGKASRTLESYQSGQQHPCECVNTKIAGDTKTLNNSKAKISSCVATSLLHGKDGSRHLGALNLTILTSCQQWHPCEPVDTVNIWGNAKTLDN